MKKAEHKFNKNIKDSIDENARENEKEYFFYSEPKPIYIPKRKKFKR